MKLTTLSAPDSILVNVADICTMLGICERTAWKWVDKGWLPPPIRMSRAVVRWRRKDIESFIDSRKRAWQHS